MTVSLLFITFKTGSFSATRNIHKMADYLLLKAFITKWQSICYSKHLSQDGSPSATQNIHRKMAVPLLLKTFKRRQSLCYSNHHKMAVSLLFKICTRWQSLWYNIQNTAVFLCLKTFITKWPSLWYSEHSSQNGSLSATQNTHNLGASLLLRIFLPPVS